MGKDTTNQWQYINEPVNILKPVPHVRKGHNFPFTAPDHTGGISDTVWCGNFWIHDIQYLNFQIQGCTWWFLVVSPQSERKWTVISPDGQGVYYGQCPELALSPQFYPYSIDTIIQGHLGRHQLCDHLHGLGSGFPYHPQNVLQDNLQWLSYPCLVCLFVQSTDVCPLYTLVPGFFLLVDCL